VGEHDSCAALIHGNSTDVVVDIVLRRLAALDEHNEVTTRMKWTVMEKERGGERQC